MTKNVYLKAKHQGWKLQTSIDATVSWLLVFGEHFGSSVDDCTALFIRVVFIVALIVSLYVYV
jgi:NADH:ubiquinone oxidoreductase subunit 5 (subunit L)/multisubunit Na+/H+ antiporter MnhA subunit